MMVLTALDLAWALDKLADVVIGVGATFLGILLVYAIARPHIHFDDVVRFSRHAGDEGADRYGVRFRNGGRVPILTMSASVWLSVDNKVRQSSIPVPVSRDTWTNVKRPSGRLFRASPRLLVDEIDWNRYLPRRFSSPPPGARLEDIMRSLDAKLYVRVAATSTIFSVTVIRTRWYGATDFGSAIDSDQSPAASKTN